MSFKAMSLCLEMLAASFVTAGPAYARATTAFSAFRVEINSLTSYPGNPYLCLLENNGAVVNACTYTVGLEFDLPIDTANTKAIKVQNGWAAIYTTTGNKCLSFAYTGRVGAGIVGNTIAFSGPTQTLATIVSMPAGYTSIQVRCNVPPGDAISNFRWNS